MLQSCGLPRDPNPSILVIAIENLGFQSVACGTEVMAHREMSGFRIFCEESVRFTHAFTPSLMTQSALASVMTGLYPFEHGLRHNGNQFLSAEYKTLAEVALEEGYRTALFSGGPPLLRSSGLNQGFEVFDEGPGPRLGLIHRPSRQLARSFDRWLSAEVSGRRFFATIFFADLQFPKAPTRSDLGELRESSVEAQLFEIGETLDQMIRKLKEQKRWDNTYVFLFGTNGRLDKKKLGDPEGAENVGLQSFNTQVPLFIKPARKSRDLGIEWKIDKNVSLADAGATVFDILGTGAPKGKNPEVHTISLRPALIRAESPWRSDRLIYSETAWPDWMGWGGIRFSLRKDQYLYIHDSQPKLFNSLIDRFEQTPFQSTDPFYQDLFDSFQRSAKNLGKTFSYKRKEMISAQYSKALYSPEGLEGFEAQLSVYLQRNPRDRSLMRTLAERAIRKGDWKELEKLGRQARITSWIYVAKKNLRSRVRWRPRACYKLMVSRASSLSLEDLSQCDDRLLLRMVNWLRERDETQRELIFQAFLTDFSALRLRRQIAEDNIQSFYSWLKPDENADTIPLIDLYLALPENVRIRNFVESRLCSGADSC